MKLAPFFRSSPIIRSYPGGLLRILCWCVAVLLASCLSAEASQVLYSVTFDGSGYGEAGTGSFVWDDATQTITEFRWDFGNGLTGGITGNADMTQTAQSLLRYLVLPQDPNLLGSTRHFEGDLLYGSFPNDVATATFLTCIRSNVDIGCAAPRIPGFFDLVAYAFREPAMREVPRDNPFGVVASGYMRATPVGPLLLINGDLSFGNVLAGASKTATLTIGNTGSAALAVTGITYPAGFSGDWASGTIAPGASQAVTVTFAPTTATGYGGTVKVNANQAGGTDTITVSGNGATPAQLTTPAPGSTLTASTVQFQWTGGTGVSQYQLTLGTTAGGDSLYAQNQGTSLTATVTGLPTDGSAVYVRLWSLIGNAWQFNDYTYTATTTTQTARAQLTTPAPQSTLTETTVLFQWSGGTGVSQYWLTLGATAGGNSLFTHNLGTSLSATVTGLPADGSTVYVRLWSLIGTAWQFNDYTYAATTTTQTTARAQLTTPAPGSTLTASTVQFQWLGGTGVSQYWLTLGTTPGGNSVYTYHQGTSLTATVTRLPTVGSTVYVRLWSLIGSAWEFNDYTYTSQTTARAQLTSPAPGSTLSASTVQFQWSGGTGVSQYWLTLGTTAGGNDLRSQNQGTSLTATVTGAPTDGSTVYVRLWSLIGNAWQFNDYTYTATIAQTTRAQLTTPAPGSTLTATTVQFEWSGGTGVSQYWLTLGTTAGGNNVYSQNQGTSLTATVTGLPTDGSTVYVRLWSLIGNAWQFNDYTYTATTTQTARAQLTTPAPGSTLTATTVQFQWSGGTGVSQHWLTLGTTTGGSGLYSYRQGTSLSATVTGLPTDGSTVYVRLWSMLGDAWQFNDYTYTAAH
jgi:hypothetical protein